jgi:hypothetical protein
LNFTKFRFSLSPSFRIKVSTSANVIVYECSYKGIIIPNAIKYSSTTLPCSLNLPPLAFSRRTSNSCNQRIYHKLIHSKQYHLHPISPSIPTHSRITYRHYKKPPHRNPHLTLHLDIHKHTAHRPHINRSTTPHSPAPHPNPPLSPSAMPEK